MAARRRRAPISVWRGRGLGISPAPLAIAERLRAARGDRPIDIVVQPIAARRKKLFLADMDSTMIGQECIDELADFAGLKAHVAPSPSAPCAARSPSSRRCASAWRC